MQSFFGSGSWQWNFNFLQRQFLTCASSCQRLPGQLLRFIIAATMQLLQHYDGLWLPILIYPWFVTSQLCHRSFCGLWGLNLILYWSWQSHHLSIWLIAISYNWHGSSFTNFQFLYPISLSNYSEKGKTLNNILRVGIKKWIITV